MQCPHMWTPGPGRLKGFLFKFLLSFMYAGPLLHSSIVTFIVIVYLFSKRSTLKKRTHIIIDGCLWEHEAYFIQ